jgi:hypothetical protein
VQVTDFVRARFLSVAWHTRNIVGRGRDQQISLVLGGTPVLLLRDLGAMPSRDIRPGRLLHTEPLLSSAVCRPIAQLSIVCVWARPELHPLRALAREFFSA